MNASLSDLVGLDAASALERILVHLDQIQGVRLAECQPLPLLQNRLDLTASERSVVERALVQRGHTGLSFWDSVLLELPGTPEAFRLLDAAMMHNSFVGREQIIPRASALSGGIRRACEDFQPTGKSSLTFLSEVACNDGVLRHLPMIDFHSASSARHRTIVEAITQRLFPDGALLLESGESYHAYGIGLLSEGEFRRFLGRSLLCAPIVDRAYLAHQWTEGRCALRLTAGGGKSTVPKVVSMLSGR